MHELMERNAARASTNVTFQRTEHSADPESCGSYKRPQVVEWQASTCLDSLIYPFVSPPRPVPLSPLSLSPKQDRSAPH